MKAMIEPTIWTDPDFEDFKDPIPILIYIYLISNSQCNTLGLYKLSLRSLLFDTRLSRDQWNTSLSLLKDKVKYDPDTNWLWIKALFAKNWRQIKNPSVAQSVMNKYAEIPEDCPFRKQFSEHNKNTLTLVWHRCRTIKDKDKDKDKDKKRTQNVPTKQLQREFAETWKIYPNKAGKHKAENDFFKARLHGVKLEKIQDGIKRYKDYVAECQKKFNMPYQAGSTWFHNWGWDDEYNIVKKEKKSMSDKQYFEKVLNEILIKYNRTPENKRPAFLKECTNKYKKVNYKGVNVIKRAKKVIKQHK